MNTSTKTLFATALIAIAGTTGLVIHAESTAPKQEIVKLERVVINGKRANPDTLLAQRVEQLPRVVIVGRRAGAESTQLASAATCPPQVIC